jgi:DNA mismatch repair protein MSH2
MVGICVFLAHIGSFVPCDSAIIPITSSIHARVGAWDSFQMSTFTVEMTEMAGILESAQPSSLAIIDELGRSTSCSDGFGLAWAISKRLATRIGSFCLFATHFHELCRLEEEINCVKNLHMDAIADQGLLMLYRLKSGPFPKSFGIDAAARAGFPPSVMKRAIEKAKELEIADGEGGEVSGPIRIDPNEPYRNVLRKVLALDCDSLAIPVIVATTERYLSEFDEELRKTSILEGKT